MAGTKHLIVIHGRASKPSEKEKKRLVLKALKHGLGRVDASGDTAKRIGASSAIPQNKRVKFSFVYYGDFSNTALLEKKPDLKAYLKDQDPDHDNTACEVAGSYDADLDRLFARTQFTKAAYKKLLKEEKDTSALDDVASVVSAIGNLFGLNDELIAKATPDMGAYLLTRGMGSAVRDRLQRPLKKALADGDDICLVSHSMGCIVAYDVLWKFSNMSEYREIRDSKNKINLWLTLGNPLGEPGVKKNLYDAHEPDDGRYPRHIIKHWKNIAAKDDFVAHDAKIGNDYKGMLTYIPKGSNKIEPLIDSIKDEPLIYTFWAGNEGANPHKFYGYLDHPNVAHAIKKWMDD
jgi:hypothetical protein